jgi:hypothetical protein
LQFDEAYFAGRIVAVSAVAAMTHSDDVEVSPFAYGMGWMLSEVAGHREVWHNGGVPGFNARNSVFPDDKLAIVVLGNSIAFDEGPIVRGILTLIDPALSTRAPATARIPLDDPKIATLARAVFRETQAGTIDRSRYTDTANEAFTEARIRAVGAQLAALGAPTSMTLRDRSYVGNLQRFTYRLQFAAFAVDETLTLDGNGKITGLLFRPALDVP